MRPGIKTAAAAAAVILAMGSTACAAAYQSQHIHSYTWVSVKLPTCTEDGEERYICTGENGCGNNFGVRGVKASGHTDGNWTVSKEPTCEEAGEETLLCSVCGEITEKRELAAPGHTDGQWVTSEAPTCTAAGVSSLSCSVCGGLLKAKAIPPLGHMYPGTWTVIREASCREEGIRKKRCSRCGHEISERTAKKEHLYGPWRAAASGSEKRVCTVCGHEEIVKGRLHTYQALFETLVLPVAENYKNVSVTYRNPASGETFSCGTADAYLTQSTIKAAYCAYLVYAGVDMSDTITLSQPVMKSASGILVEENIGERFSIETLIDYALRHSDNQAYYMLVSRYGRNGYNSFIQKVIGISHPLLSGSSLFSYASSSEMAEVMSYIFQHSSACAGLISSMSSLNALIADGTDNPVAQKYGYSTDSYHDIAIIYDNVPYILSIFTNEASGTDAFEKITKAVEVFHETITD